MKNQYYNKEVDRLFWEFNQIKPQDEYWDAHWHSTSQDVPDFLEANRPTMLIKQINKFIKKGILPSGAKILEAGCGLGQKVYHLEKEGFDIEGIDFTRETVDKIRRYVNVFFGDLNAIPRDDAIYDCCLSYGVVEHSLEGPERILNEMHRVTKNGGILFCSVPHINFVRKIKILINAYHSKDINTEYFYQYAFNRKNFLEILNKCGYDFISSYNYAALKGLKDEVNVLNNIIGSLNKIKPPFNIIIKLLNYGLGFFSGHMKMYILKVEK